MPYERKIFFITLPNPYDPEASWEDIHFFHSKQEALDFVSDVLAGDEEGRIDLISHIDDEGWLVDLPNPQHLEDAWIFVESFTTKREAVKFVKSAYGADAQGRLKAIEVVTVSLEEKEERGPRDWSPRWKKRKKK